MEFPFDCERLLKCDEDGFSIINSNSRKYIPENSVYDIDNIIRTLGKLSSSQRHLDFIATTPENFFLDDINETIIIKAKSNFVIGFIRFGFKKILLRNYKNYTKNFIKKLLTIIDFYVYFDVQRKHYGKEIFDKVIKMYNIQPYYMAYDIPNKIMYNFLFKNYLIGNPIQQDNDIVVYNEFIDENEEKGKTQSNNIKNLTINVNDNNKINYNNDNYNNSNVKDLDNKNINYNFFDYNNEEKNNDEDYQTEYSDNYKFINQNLYNKSNLNDIRNRVDFVYNTSNNSNNFKFKKNNNLVINPKSDYLENNRYNNLDNQYNNRIINSPKRLIYSENNLKSTGQNIINRNFSDQHIINKSQQIGKNNIFNQNKNKILYPITPSYSCSAFEQNILNSIQGDDYQKFNKYFFVTDKTLKNQNYQRKNYNPNSYDQNEYFHKMVDKEKRFFSNRLNNIRNLENVIINSRGRLNDKTLINNDDYYQKNKYFATIFDKDKRPYY